MMYDIINWWVHARVYESLIPHQDDPKVHGFLYMWMMHLVQDR